MKLQTIKRPDGQVCYVFILNKAIVEAKGWKKGQELKAVFNHKGNVELTE